MAKGKCTRQFCSTCLRYHRTNSKARTGYYDINHKAPLAETPGDVKAMIVGPNGVLLRESNTQTSTLVRETSNNKSVVSRGIA